MKADGKKVALFLAGLLLCVAGIVAVSGETVTWSIPSDSFRGGGEDLFSNQTGVKLSLERKLATLEELDFQFTEEERKAMEEWPDAGYGDLLAMVGWGEFDNETWEWSPTSDQVYALDTEAFNIDRMYLDFLQGLLSISSGSMRPGTITRALLSFTGTKLGLESLRARQAVSCIQNSKNQPVGLRKSSEAPT